MFPINDSTSWRFSFLHWVPVSRVPHHQRYYKSATTSHGFHPLAYCFRFRDPHACLPPSSFLGSLGGSPKARSISRYHAICCVATHGISQVPDQSILYLCPALRPRSDCLYLAFSIYLVLPPLLQRWRLQRLQNFEALSHGFSIHCLRFTNAVTDAHAKLVSDWWLVFVRRESNPLDCNERFPILCHVSFPLLRLILSQCKLLISILAKSCVFLKHFLENF